jgi:malonyl CoA-acyl carrier protein transacylase
VCAPKKGPTSPGVCGTHVRSSVITQLSTTPDIAVQVTNPVLWENSVADVLGRGYERGFECGPGKVIAGILKRVDKKAAITNIEV